MASSSVRIELNHAGMRSVLRSAEVAAELGRRASRVAARAGEGMGTDVYIGRNRARASVHTDTNVARRAEAIDRSLTRSIDAARG